METAQKAWAEAVHGGRSGPSLEKASPIQLALTQIAADVSCLEDIVNSAIQRTAIVQSEAETMANGADPKDACPGSSPVVRSLFESSVRLRNVQQQMRRWIGSLES